MNNFHRFINLPFTIERPKIFDTLKVPKWSSGGMTFEIDKQHVDQRILEWLDKFNISTSQFFEGTYTAPNKGSIGIHSDTDTLTDMTKLLFIWGPKNSFTRWWEPKIDANSHKMRPDQGGPHAEIFNPDTYVYEFDDADRALCYEEKDCNLLYEKVLSKPSIINAGRLHSTFNNGGEDRWGLTLTLIKNNKRLQFSEALEVFKDIIDE